MSDSAPASPQLSLDDTEDILGRLAAGGDSKIVLVGGQALNYWAEYYMARVPELAADAPFTSGDVDVLGDRKHLHKCAISIGGQAIEDSDKTDPRAGHVLYHDHLGREIEIDFMERLEGVTPGQVERTAVPVDLPPNGEGKVTRYWVMQPVLCMKSRIKNVMLLGKHYYNAHGLKQLRASVICAREYMKDLVRTATTPQHDKDINELNEEIFRFCTKDEEGKRVHLLPSSADPFSTIAVDGTGDKQIAFREKRHPRMVEALNELRKTLVTPVFRDGRFWDP